MVKTVYVDEEKLDEMIKNSGLKVTFIVEQLGISLAAFYKKKRGTIPFRAAEIFTLCTLLGIPQEEKPKIFVTK